jgi:hypothetical protein
MDIDKALNLFTFHTILHILEVDSRITSRVGRTTFSKGRSGFSRRLRINEKAASPIFCLS